MGRSVSRVAVEIVRSPRITEPKVDRSEEPFPVKSAAASDSVETALTLSPAVNVPSPLPAKVVT